ncbi:MAG: MFS transporter [Desulfovibrionales bacterium]
MHVIRLNGMKMTRKDQAIITVVTILTISALYTPQPVLPLLQDAFHLTRPTAALLVSVSLLPLGFAPLVYGLLLSKVPPRKMLQTSVSLLAISEAAIALADTFGWILSIRLVQGFLISASLTALMTTISGAASSRTIGRNMALYISSTIIGGFTGRFASGVIASFWGWRASFWVMFFALAGAALLLFSFSTGKKPEQYQPMRFSLLKEVVSRPLFLRVYVSVFCLFFVFASLLNFLPFRLNELTPGAPAIRSAFLYLGYLTGLIASLASTRSAGRIGGESKAIFLGFCVYLISLGVFFLPREEILYPAMFLFCGSMFFIHSLAPGLLNTRERRHKGVVNGLYIAFYYLGGSLGSYIPGFVYRAWGWSAFLFCLAAVLATAVLVSGSMLKGQRDDCAD